MSVAWNTEGIEHFLQKALEGECIWNGIPRPRGDDNIEMCLKWNMVFKENPLSPTKGSQKNEDKFWLTNELPCTLQN